MKPNDEIDSEVAAALAGVVVSRKIVDAEQRVMSTAAYCASVLINPRTLTEQRSIDETLTSIVLMLDEPRDLGARPAELAERWIRIGTRAISHLTILRGSDRTGHKGGGTAS